MDFAGKKSKKSRTIVIAVVTSVASVVLIISIGVYSSVKKAIHRRDESKSAIYLFIYFLQFWFQTLHLLLCNIKSETI